jgi:hypothetical protein
VIRTILRSFPKSNFDEESWLPMLQRGLHDILFSKISKRQRDPAMQLVAAVIEVSGTRSEVETRFISAGKFTVCSRRHQKNSQQPELLNFQEVLRWKSQRIKINRLRL